MIPHSVRCLTRPQRTARGSPRRLDVAVHGPDAGKSLKKWHIDLFRAASIDVGEPPPTRRAFGPPPSPPQVRGEG
jgi:hypothetical protein